MPLRIGQEVQALPRAARVAPAAVAPIDRTELRRAYRPDEEQVSQARITQARLKPEELAEATATARALVRGVRAHKPAGVDAFLHAYDLLFVRPVCAAQICSVSQTLHSFGRR